MAKLQSIFTLFLTACAPPGDLDNDLTSQSSRGLDGFNNFICFETCEDLSNICDPEESDCQSFNQLCNFQCTSYNAFFIDQVCTAPEMKAFYACLGKRTEKECGRRYVDCFGSLRKEKSCSEFTLTTNEYFKECF